MDRPLHLPSPNEINTPRWDYPAFPRRSGDWLQRSLEKVSVKGVTAILYQCTSRWKMDERRIGDDMFFYIIKGKGEARVEERSHTLLPGICSHFRRGIPHAATTDSRNPIHVISVHYTATLFETLTLPELMRFPDFFHISGDGMFDRMMREACREYALRPAGHGPGLEALVIRMLLHLIRKQGDFPEMQAHNSKVSDIQRLLPALELMGRDLVEPKSIPSLARSTGYSEAQFRRVFERAIGMAPVQYQRRIRMERACLLLRQTSQTIESIAGEVGYAEPAFFAHTFKKMMGIAPGEYRRTHEL